MKYRDKETGEVVEVVNIYRGIGYCVVSYPDGVERARPIGEKFHARFEPMQDQPTP